MAFNDEQWSDFKFEESKAIGFADLPYSIKEQICSFVESRHDQCEIALAHRQWSTAAQAALFYHPRFDRPEQLRSFIRTIKTWNRIALLVKVIQLTYVDHEEDTVFKTIVKSNKSRHSYNTPLKDLNILTNIIQTCEKVESVTIYGWDMQSYHIETLASLAKNLTSLYIIGANKKAKANPNTSHPFSLNSLLPNLVTLRLDGDFGLTEAWAANLVHKGARLQRLQISFQNMNKNVLDTICSRDLRLTELTITDAISLADNHVFHIVDSFPRLTKLCIEGACRLTSVTIALALKFCPELVDLEIRAHFSAYDISSDAESNMNEIVKIMQGTKIARLSRLVLENMTVSDDEFMLFSPYLTHLYTLGLKSCNLMTNKSLLHLFDTHPNSRKFLRHLYISNCPHITSMLLAEISHIKNISRSLMDIHIESCGDILPRDIYQLCCSCVNYNLRRLTFMDYMSLEKTVIGSFNENRVNQNVVSKILLNKQSIDALACSNDSELVPVPKNRLLSGQQIILLAKHLRMTTSSLEELLNRVKKEEAEQTNSSNIHINVTPPLDLSKRKDRLGMLKGANAPSSEPRPNTPAIWNKEFENGFLPTDNKGFQNNGFQNEFSATDNSNDDEDEFAYTENSEERNSYENDDSFDSSYNDNDENSYNDNDRDEEQDNEEYDPYYDDNMMENGSRDKDEEDVENDEEEYDTRGDFDNGEEYYNGQDYDIREDYDNDRESYVQPRGNKWMSEDQIEFSGEIDLGGWGTSNNDWSSPSNSAAAHKQSPVKTSKTSFQQLMQEELINQEQQRQRHEQEQQQQLQKANTWNGYRSEDYQKKWVPDPMEVNTQPQPKKQISSYRNRPDILENDGWGKPEKYVPWENVKDQGFAADVLNKQKSTQYWQYNENGWVTLNNNDDRQEAAQDERVSKKPYTVSDTDFPALQAPSDKAAVPLRALAEKARAENGRQSRFSRARSNSVVSSDSDVNWDLNDNVQFKLHNNDTINDTPKQTNGNKKASGKWASATEWKSRNEGKKENWGADVVSSPVKANKPDVPPNVDDDLKATKSWSAFANSNTISRRSYSRPRSSTSRSSSLITPKESTPQETALYDVDQWNGFSAANKQMTSGSPPRSNNGSPFKKVEQRSTTPSVDTLIDTDSLLVNTTTFSSNPVKNEVWETLNELSSAKTNTMNDILQPKKEIVQQASTPAITEYIDWTIDDLPSSNASVMVSSPTFHFKPTVSGTVTEEEISRARKEEAKNNLVSLDSPTMTTMPVSKPTNEHAQRNKELESALADLVGQAHQEIESISTMNKDVERVEKNEQDMLGPESSSPQPQASDDEQKKKFFVRLQVETGKGNAHLILEQDDNVAEKVKEFCEQHDMMHNYDQVLKSSEEKFQKRKTKYILRKTKKSKKAVN